MPDDSLPTYRLLLRRALTNAEPANLPVFFERAVLERYRGAPGFSIIRTDTVGRVRKQGGWSLDFGIAPGEEVIHLAWADVPKIPEEDRQHWADHAVGFPASRMYLQMRMAPGSCFDDGDVRDWD
jgi:hypothetical protein